MIEVPGTTTFKKRFPKIDFLKAVSVAMIANKLSKSPPQLLYSLFSPLLFPPDNFLKNWYPTPTQCFEIFISPLQKTEGMG